MAPLVTFYIPCYKLAHLLPECVNSILAQTFGDLEVLILDDCSPDNTPEVARSFRDKRVQHIRNESNLGHLRNYNKGIGLARGKYVWQISPDDCLRKPYILERYVGVMEKDPNIGYAFCPAAGLLDSKDIGLLKYSYAGDLDTIMEGHDLLRLKLLAVDCVTVAAGMTRKECYERLGMFPLDMPFAADWYLWLLFALHYKVAYFAEPMVYYRLHAESMTSDLVGRDPRICGRDELAVLWSIKHRAEAAGFRSIAASCEDHIVNRTVNYLDRGDRRPWLTIEDLEESLQKFGRSALEGRRVLARVYARWADEHYWRRDFNGALGLYSESLHHRFWVPKILVKYLLLRTGRMGRLVSERLRVIPAGVNGGQRELNNAPGSGL
jgi:glycosyltransferase involved in cell wall biosynthesis